MHQQQFFQQMYHQQQSQMCQSKPKQASPQAKPSPAKQSRPVIVEEKENVVAQPCMAANADGAAFSMYINGVLHSLPAVDPTMTLNTYIRSQRGLAGTKISCNEGGCGACTVVMSDGTNDVSINSCLRPLAACNGKHITTVEGIGSEKKGLHPIQQRLADADGTQCGYCSPGFVMNMYSLLENNPKPTEEEIENYFDGNICRCTGYRPIFTAFKSFAADASENSEAEKAHVPRTIDAESTQEHEHAAGHQCSKKGTSCKKGGEGCKNSCKLKAQGVQDIEELVLPKYPKYQHEKKEYPTIPVTPGSLKSLTSVQWLSPSTLPELYNILDSNDPNLLALVFGHTSWGIFKSFRPQIYVDLQNIPALGGQSYNANKNRLEFGGTNTITAFLAAIEAAANSSAYTAAQKASLPELAYMVHRVAHTQVRNVGSIAGNLMLANKHSFPSDLMIALMGLGGSVVVSNSAGEKELDLPVFLTYDMAKSVLLKVCVPLGVQNQQYMNQKVAKRNVNSHSIVNSSISFIVDPNSFVITQPVIAYGNVQTKQARMFKTEAFLQGKSLLQDSTLSGALQTLQTELNVDPNIPDVQYRQSVALTMFYKFYLSCTPESRITPKKRSGASKLTRGVSTGEQSFQSDASEYPVSSPIHILKGTQQTSGTAQYTGDIPVTHGSLFGALTLSTVASADIAGIDPSNALALEGVVDWVSAADIPGVNGTDQGIELFATKSVLFHGQAIGLIVAKSQEIADVAAHLVKVTYKNVATPIVTIEDAIAKKAIFPWSIPPVQQGNVDQGLKESTFVFKGQVSLGPAYHFHMETQTAIATPGDDNEFYIQAATQMTAYIQANVASVLKLPIHKITVDVKKCGGGYGGKLLNSELLISACAVAANKLGLPVRSVMELQTNMAALGKRPATLAYYEVGFYNNLQLAALKVNTYTNGGCMPNDASFVVQSLMNTLDSCYMIPNFYANGVVVKTNMPPQTAMRGPGWTPGILIMEHVMEHAAQALQMKPANLKKFNFFQKGQVTPTGTKLVYWNLDVIWAQLLKTSDYEARSASVAQFNQANQWKKRGISIVPVRWEAGWTGDHQTALVNVYPDGSVLVCHSGVEIGQGIDTKVAQTVAYALQIPLNLITTGNETSVTAPNNSGTGGSVTSALCCAAAKQACDELNKSLIPVRKAVGPQATWQQVVAKALQLGVALQQVGNVFPGPPPNSPNALYNSYSAAVQEVEVDILTGEITLVRTDILFDAGVSLNPAVDIGQIEGAFVMGLGNHLTENIHYSPDGVLTNNGTWEYKPPSGMDIPLDIRVTLLKDAPNPMGFLGSKCTGEPPLALSCVARFAVQAALVSFRKDLGLDFQSFSLNNTSTIDVIQTMSGLQVKDLTL